MELSEKCASVRLLLSSPPHSVQCFSQRKPFVQAETSFSAPRVVTPQGDRDVSEIGL